MDQFSGLWVVDKSHTTGIDPMLKLQGISWPLRKAVGLATMRLDISIHTDDRTGTTSLDTVISLTGGMAGTTEKRGMDWSVQDHKDYFFGTCQHRSCFVYVSSEGKGDGKVYPEFDMQTDVSDEKVKMFLRGEILDNGEASAWAIPGTGEKGSDKVWVHTFVRNLDAGWTAEQIWGFEEIDGQLYQTKRIVTANAKGQYAMGRQVLRKE
ncbi:hypothetical protein BDV12DRAFT_189361 [Aspergillus spectabilis]